jgi:hypothetical protein
VNPEGRMNDPLASLKPSDISFPKHDHTVIALKVCKGQEKAILTMTVRWFPLFLQTSEHRSGKSSNCEVHRKVTGVIQFFSTPYSIDIRKNNDVL